VGLHVGSAELEEKSHGHLGCLAEPTL
jgi:hypothetical protein